MCTLIIIIEGTILTDTDRSLPRYERSRQTGIVLLTCHYLGCKIISVHTIIDLVCLITLDIRLHLLDALLEVIEVWRRGIAVRVAIVVVLLVELAVLVVEIFVVAIWIYHVEVSRFWFPHVDLGDGDPFLLDVREADWLEELM